MASSSNSRLIALLGLLAVAGYQNRDKIKEMLGAGGSAAPTPTGMPPSGQPSQADGGILGDIFGGALRGGSAPGGGILGGAGGLGGLLGGLFGGGSVGGGLAGGLNDLIEQFNGKGQGELTKSWVETGDNKPVTSDQVGQVLDPTTIDALVKQTGLSKEELLKRLSTILPVAVDSMTPEGRVPSAQDMDRRFS